MGKSGQVTANELVDFDGSPLHTIKQLLSRRGRVVDVLTAGDVVYTFGCQNGTPRDRGSALMGLVLLAGPEQLAELFGKSVQVVQVYRDGGYHLDIGPRWRTRTLAGDIKSRSARSM
jgi:hypothetical protein